MTPKEIAREFYEADTKLKTTLYEMFSQRREMAKRIAGKVAEIGGSQARVEHDFIWHQMYMSDLGKIQLILDSFAVMEASRR